ncbi:MAG: hypothetical protein NC915_01405, partial [Candidatus Omnitrophica bacterium]|nr:hypothetical protein [Candidatus Omnitrophota bacterium]
LEQVLLVTIFQYILCNFFKFKIVPSVFLAYLLLLSFRGEIEIALFLSFILGLLNDIFIKDIPGSSSIRFLLIVYFSSFFVVKSIKSKCFLIFIFSFLYFVLTAFKKTGEIMWQGGVFLKYAILFSLYNFLFSWIVELFIEEIRKIWKERTF